MVGWVCMRGLCGYGFVKGVLLGYFDGILMGQLNGYELRVLYDFFLGIFEWNPVG